MSSSLVCGWLTVGSGLGGSVDFKKVEIVVASFSADI
jgi:hypothetical protein